METKATWSAKACARLKHTAKPARTIFCFEFLIIWSKLSFDEISLPERAVSSIGRAWDCIPGVLLEAAPGKDRGIGLKAGDRRLEAGSYRITGQDCFSPGSSLRLQPN
jgi:hypothetical protein